MPHLDPDRLQVDPRKLRDYLLSPEHPQGGAKARFFLSLGYSRERPWELGAELRRLGGTEEITVTVRSVYGVKHVVDGLLRGARVRTV